MAGRRGRTLARLVLCGGVFLLWTGALGYKRLLGSGAGHADHRDTAGFGKECEQSAAGGRHLLQLALRNCTPRAINEFPPDVFTYEERIQGGVALHVFLAIYIFSALAIVCDEYFVSALERITETLGIMPDVAGATFMAAGSSAPEFFTSVIGVFFTKSDVGVGTIVGSAVFNIIVIIAICSLFAGMVVYLTWWPLFRDCMCYMISVITLIIVIRDGVVYWYEALIMLILYIGYIVIMYFNSRLSVWAVKKRRKIKRKLFPNLALGLSGSFSHDGKSETAPLLHHNSGDHKRAPQDEERGEYEEYEDDDGVEVAYSDGSVHVTHLDVEYESPWLFPETLPKRIYWVLMLPATFFFFFTIPDCRRPGCWQKMFVLTFLSSVVWIAGLSYVMVWMVTIIGDTLDIPDSIMGLTLLAAGTSIPDALASLFVARDGFGDMAVSNSIGSNVFDILLCLSFPWLLQTVAVQPGSVVTINSAGLLFSAITLFGTVVFMFCGIWINGWKLDKKFGAISLVVYVAFMTLACLYELNVFGYLNPPACPRTLELI